ncbi:hypothetical protein [Tepidanaerobacter syntrophicus]|uniref:hypothetical protein n=1 Tax=Tepidanaerobacter syntrophicus TaxID=224999 RepID=UPI001BD1F2BA|nr:hypothetical protein [Tepidanaerobacter syntrophicus]
MNDTCIKLVARMILNTMAGRQKQTWQLYEKYLRERHLYVTIGDYIRWRNNHEQAN